MIGTIISLKTVKSSFAALNRSDISAFLAGWAEDATFIYPGNMSVSGEIKGKPAIEAWFQRFFEQFPKVRFSLKSVCVKNIFDFVGSNVVAVEWDIEVTNREGQDFQNSGVTVITIEKTKGILVRDYIFDLDTLKREWGE